jgi:large subunit ribosomal protein L10
MSKRIKQMEMDALKTTFQDIRDMVLLSISGVDAHGDHSLRSNLRKKNIRLQMVKNSLARRVFGEIGVDVASAWEKSTFVAWGAGSLAELSRELDGLIKKNDKIKVKTAVSDGQELAFDRAKTLPTKNEAIARIVSLVLSPATRVVSQVLAPASRIAAQIKTLSERSAEAPPSEAAAAPATVG